MANVNKILLPRRGKKSVMQSAGKSSIVLEKGELFVECSDEGVGVGHDFIKIGVTSATVNKTGPTNGNVTYTLTCVLKDGTKRRLIVYAIGDTSNDAINFSESAETEITSAIGKLISGAKLNVLIANIKKCITILKNNYDTTANKFTALTDNNGITEVKLVTSLPADASSHPTTLYLIKSS